MSYLCRQWNATPQYKKLTSKTFYNMNKSQNSIKHYAEQKKIQKCLYCMITHTPNFRKDKPKLQGRKVDHFSRADGVGATGRGHKGT